MGRLIGCSRHAVSYWETKKHPHCTSKQHRFGVPGTRCSRFSALRFCRIIRRQQRARGHGVLGLSDAMQAMTDREMEKRRAMHASAVGPSPPAMWRENPQGPSMSYEIRTRQSGAASSTGASPPDRKQRKAGPGFQRPRERRWAAYRSEGELVPERCNEIKACSRLMYQGKSRCLTARAH